VQAAPGVVFADADGSLDGADLPAEVLLGLGMADRGSGWALEMIARAGNVGLRVVEVPVRYRPAPAPQQGQRLAAGTVRAIGAMAVVTLALVRERRARRVHRVRRGKSLVSSGFSPRLPASLRCRSSARATLDRRSLHEMDAEIEAASLVESSHPQDADEQAARPATGDHRTADAQDMSPVELGRLSPTRWGLRLGHQTLARRSRLPLGSGCGWPASCTTPSPPRLR